MVFDSLGYAWQTEIRHAENCEIVFYLDGIDMLTSNKISSDCLVGYDLKTGVKNSLSGSGMYKLYGLI